MKLGKDRGRFANHASKKAKGEKGHEKPKYLVSFI
jgi:hypothetical protein